MATSHGRLSTQKRFFNVYVCVLLFESDVLHNFAPCSQQRVLPPTRLLLTEIRNCHYHRRFKVTRKSYTVKKLREGQEYEFRVTAENDVGQSAPSQSVFSKYGISNSLFYFFRDALLNK